MKGGHFFAFEIFLFQVIFSRHRFNANSPVLQNALANRSVITELGVFETLSTVKPTEPSETQQ